MLGCKSKRIILNIIALYNCLAIGFQLLSGLESFDTELTLRVFNRKYNDFKRNICEFNLLEVCINKMNENGNKIESFF